MFRAYVESKGSVRLTDLMESANAAGSLQMSYGLTFDHLPETDAIKKSKLLTLTFGKMNIPSDPTEAATMIVPFARKTNARTSNKAIIDHVIENRVAGVVFYGPDGEVLDEDNLKKLRNKGQRASAVPIQYIEFKKLAVPE